MTIWSLLERSRTAPKHGTLIRAFQNVRGWLRAWQILEVRDFLWLADALVPPLTEATLKMKEAVLHYLCNVCMQCLPAWLLGLWGTAGYRCGKTASIGKAAVWCKQMIAGCQDAKCVSFQATTKFTCDCSCFRNQAFALVLFVCTAEALWLDSLEARKAWKWNVTQKTDSLV